MNFVESINPSTCGLGISFQFLSFQKMFSQEISVSEKRSQRHFGRQQVTSFCWLQTLQVSSDLEREELKNALVATQESAAIQILLEAVLGTGQPLPLNASSAAREQVRESELVSVAVRPRQAFCDTSICFVGYIQKDLELYFIPLGKQS